LKGSFRLYDKHLASRFDSPYRTQVAGSVLARKLDHVTLGRVASPT
jgi:hypothetical protein